MHGDIAFELYIHGGMGTPHTITLLDGFRRVIFFAPSLPMKACLSYMEPILFFSLNVLMARNYFK